MLVLILSFLSPLCMHFSCFPVHLTRHFVPTSILVHSYHLHQTQEAASTGTSIHMLTCTRTMWSSSKGIMFASCSTSDEVGLLKIKYNFSRIYIHVQYIVHIQSVPPQMFAVYILYFQFHLTDEQLTRMDESVRSRPFLLPQLAFR